VIVNIIFYFISKCGSELCYFNYKMSSGPPHKRNYKNPDRHKAAESE